MAEPVREDRIDRVFLRRQIRNLKAELRRLHAIRSEYGEPADLHAQVQELRGAVNLAADALAMVNAAASAYVVATYEGIATPEQRDDLDTAAKAASVVEKSIRATLASTPKGD